MASIERTAYPRFGRSPSTAELARLYTPTLGEIDLASRATHGDEQSLAFLVMLKSFQNLGYFPKPDEVPESIVSRVRSSLRLPEVPTTNPDGALTTPDTPDNTPERSLRRYRDAIREHLEVKAFGRDGRRIAAEAVTEAATTMDDPADLVNVAIEELVKERFELPSFAALDRLARHARHTVNSGLFARVGERLSLQERDRLDALLVADSRGRSDLNALKAVPGSATKKNLSELQECLSWLESFGDTKTLISSIPNQKVANLAAQARALDASELKDVSEERRRAMLTCLLDRSKVLARDGLSEMLVKIVGKLHNRGKESLEELHRERRTAVEEVLDAFGEIVQGAKELEGESDAALGCLVREILAERGGADDLSEQHAALSAHKGGNYLPLLWEPYKVQRATLFRVADSLVFCPTTEDRSLTGALDFILENKSRRGEWLPDPGLDLSFASERWRALVLGERDGGVVLHRRHLEVCIFSYVAEELRTGDLCVEGSEKYADYREQLLSWEECEPLVEQHCLELGLAPTAEGFVAQLRAMLSETAEEVDRAYPENASVVISEEGEPVLKKIRADKPTKRLRQ